MSKHSVLHFGCALGMLLAQGCASVKIAQQPSQGWSHMELKNRCQAGIEESKTFLNQILQVKGQRNIENTLKPFNEMWIQIDKLSAESNLISNVHPDKQEREDAEQCEKQITSFVTDLSLNHVLYEAFCQIDASKLDSAAARVLEKTLLDFRRAGVDKDEQTRERIKAINQELVSIGQEFGRNIREDVRTIKLESKADLSGLPADYIASHSPGADGMISISTDYPDYVPFMSYADSNPARQKLSFQFLNRGYPKNQPVLQAMLQKRHELAALLGYESYASYVVENKMIKTADRVEEFIKQITDLSEKRAREEYLELLQAKRDDGNKKAVSVEWFEKAYFEERLKRTKFSFNAQSVRPYFLFKNVRDGLLNLTSELFGIHYKKVSVSTWHASVDVYDVWDGNKQLGTIFLDLHPRENKYKHAAQFTLLSGVRGRQLPKGVLVCNFPDPNASSEPALMSHDDVVTLFHEFGHLLHHILGGDQIWIRNSGVATEWDFVEAPSQLFEELAWDPRALQKFAKHYVTGEVLPAEMIGKMRAAAEFGKGIQARQQMFYAAMSFYYYQKDPASFDTLELLRKLQSQYSSFPYPEGTHFNLNFGHLEGYSAMYYTYMWSKVIAKDLLTRFGEQGMLNKDVAKRYRDTVLAPGGSKDADKLVEDFLGRPYNFTAFQQWLESK